MKTYLLALLLMLPIWQSHIEVEWTCPELPWRQVMESTEVRPGDMACLHHGAISDRE